jgi:hypothetical protein
MIRSLAIALIFCASQASALSCMRPDVANSFQRFAAASESYVVLYGTFSFDDRLLPRAPAGNPNNTDPNTFITTTFVGTSLSKAGFINRFSRDITLNATCLGPWCSGMTPDVPIVAFVQKGADEYTLTIGPCGGAAFSKPSPEVLQTLTSCINGKKCERMNGFSK